MNITKMYCYLFYKFYKFFQKFKETRWLSDIKAIIILTSLEIYFLFPLIKYWNYFSHTRVDINFFSPLIILPLIVILTIKWLVFLRDNKWKSYVEEFDQWPPKKNFRGTLIVVGLILLALANFGLSFYLDPPPGGNKW